MPEPPLLPKRRPALPENVSANEATPRAWKYAELQCRTNFSFLEGASHPDELATRAAELGYTALAITDRNTLAGVVRAHVAAQAAGLKLLIGAAITPEDASPVLLYAPDIAAYGRLSRLITRGRRAAEKGECRLSLADVAEHAEGLLAAVVLEPSPSASGGLNARRIGEHTRGRSRTAGIKPAALCDRAALCKKETHWDENPPHHLEITPPSKEQDDLATLSYREIFRDRCYLTISLHHGPNDEARLEDYMRLARQAHVPLVATNDVHYHEPGRRHLQDVLTAIRHGVSVAELGARRFANAERHLKSPEQMAELFRDCPQAIANGLELADRCHFSLAELRYQYPEELCPPGQTPAEYLADLTWGGARRRYRDGVPDKVTRLLQRELTLIEELHYEAYFLTVWDLVVFARARGILCQGRGSAANSAVCFCLEITSVDPDRSDVLFERFVSRERNEAPDIDVDFEHERREEVLQYVYQKYGRDRAGIAAEVITYRLRSAVRDVGKALGWSLDRVDRLAKTLGWSEDEEKMAARLREAGLDPAAAEVQQFLRLVKDLLGFPRHLSQHVGGFVITSGLLSELVPIENAAMPDRTVVEWDKDDLDALGILKVDCLSLGMLTAIHKCFDLAKQHHGVELTLANVPAEDQRVYDMICKADTVGVFQIESRAQMAMLPRLLPRCFYDLVVEVAIVRPGPIQGDMVHPYLRRRNGEEPVVYPSPLVEEVLSKTLGVPLFQEQVMRLAMVAAGFTAGEADQLRRAMGAWRRPGLIEQYRQKMRDGMLARGLPVEFADRLFEHVRGFGEYGFPEAHAASFALLAYVSAWLKCYYPAAFTAAILNSQPMGFYGPSQLVRDAQAHDVPVRPVDVNYSDWDCTLEETLLARRASEGNADPRLRVGLTYSPALRLGLRLIKGLPEAIAQKLVAARRARPFRSVADFACRTGLSRPLLARLAAADAFASLNLSRRTALWQVLAAGQPLPLFAEFEEPEDPIPPLAAMPLEQEVVADYDYTGLSLKAHPISLLRADLDRLGVLPAAAIADQPDKSHVRVGGLVSCRQQPATAKGTIFVTLEDETGNLNLVVWPGMVERYRRAVRSATFLLADGRVERSGQVIHIVVTRLEDLSEYLGELSAPSRDFQ
jgi:error-prone DNA polymerase